jgi:hypothetical protein
MTSGAISTEPAALDSRPGPRAVMALRLRLLAWIGLEAAGLAALAVAGWGGVPQPWLTVALLARGLTIFGVMRGVRDLDPQRARAATAFGLLALALLPGFALAIVPPLFTEAGWDAVLGLCLAPTLALLAGSSALAAAGTARRAGQLGVARQLEATPLLAALAALATLPSLAADIAPTPWLAPAAWFACWALATAAGGQTRGEAAAWLLVAGLAGAAVFEHVDDPVSGRTFVATFGLLAVALVGRHLGLCLRALSGALAAEAVTPAAPRVTWRAATTLGVPLSEAEAEALVDRELGFDRGARLEARDREDLNAAPRSGAPLTLEPPAEVATKAPEEPPELHTARANALGRLLSLWLGLALALLFGALLGLTPLGGLAVTSLLVPLALAAVALALASTNRALAASFDSAARRPWRLAAGLSLGAACALAWLAFASSAAMWLTPVCCALALGVLAGTAAGLASLSRVLGAPPPRTSARLPGLLATLAVFGAAIAALARLAPGDMAWLGAPLSLAAFILIVATFHALAWALHELRQDLHDAVTRSLRGTGIARPRETSGASR